MPVTVVLANYGRPLDNEIIDKKPERHNEQYNKVEIDNVK